jgi:AmmeMemoRadiSam system protein B
MRRRPAVAGSWYPADPRRLAHDIDAYLAAGRPPSGGDVVGVLSPHAGYLYSGPVAGAAYAAVASRTFDVVCVVGPSHYMAFDGVALWPKGVFETPLGDLAIDEALGADLQRTCPVVEQVAGAHAREHSLEMQLPFLKRVCPDAPIVPLVMGYQTRETVEALARGLVTACAGRRALLVASSDLSHFFDAEACAALDARVAGHVARFDAEGLMSELERYPEGERGRFVMCGGGPAVSVMLAARGLGATTAQVLAQSHSGVVSGDFDRVVGYLAAAFERPGS